MIIVAGDQHLHNYHHHDKFDHDDVVVAFTLAKTHEQSQRAANSSQQQLQLLRLQLHHQQ